MRRANGSKWCATLKKGAWLVHKGMGGWDCDHDPELSRLGTYRRHPPVNSYQRSDKIEKTSRLKSSWRPELFYYVGQSLPAFQEPTNLRLYDADALRVNSASGYSFLRL